MKNLPLSQTAQKGDGSMKKSEINTKAVEKAIKMFSPRDGYFLGFPENEVIQGPNDRPCFGFDNFFSEEMAN